MSATSYIYLSLLSLTIVLVVLVAAPAQAATYNVTVDQSIAVNNQGNSAHGITIDGIVRGDTDTGTAEQRSILWGLSYENSGLYNNRLAWTQEGNSTVGYWQAPVQIIVEERTVTVTQPCDCPTASQGSTSEEQPQPPVVTTSNEPWIRPEVLGLGALAVFLLLIAIRLS